jgi:hypothetical protein
MNVLLDIKENKADFIMELLNSFSFVMVKPLSPYKAQVLEELKELLGEIQPTIIIF